MNPPLVADSGLRPVDLLTESVAAVAGRPLRSLLTTLGTLVGVAAFVATTGLASTAATQIGERFDALKATEVRAQAAPGAAGNPFPADTDDRLAALPGVVSGGYYWSLTALGLYPRALPTRVGVARADPIPVMAARPGALLAARPTLQAGRLYDRFLADRGERVAVLGRVAARQLGIFRTDGRTVVFIGDTSYVVIGIVDQVARNADLLVSVIVPPAAAVRDLPHGADQHYLGIVDVAPGAAQLVGHQLPLALRPDTPESLAALVPPDPRTFRQSVEGDVTGLFYALAALALFIGMVGIANATLVAVVERRNEIAVRRAMGARRRHIAVQVLTESAMLGALGAVFGVAVGLTVVGAVSYGKEWTTTIEPWVPLVAPLLGVVTGLLAGLYPAIRATHGDIAATLRQ